MKITVVFPTKTEAQFFRHSEVEVEISGVGLSATAYNTSKIIQRHQPDWLIMAGIAGAYEHSNLNIGDVFLVESECESDLGFFTPDGFTHLADLNIAMDFTANKQLFCPHLPAEKILPTVRSNPLTRRWLRLFLRTVLISKIWKAPHFLMCVWQRSSIF